MLFRSKRYSPGAVDEIVIDISEEAGIRKLHFGEYDTQSAMRTSDPYELVLTYCRCMMGFLLFAPEPARALLIGLGGGSIAKWVHRSLPRTQLTCVELHPQVVGVARSMFHLPEDDERLEVIVGDGAAHVWQMDEDSADLIMMDAYSATGIAPPLATTDFFAACRALHQDEADPELMFQDYEGFPGNMASECHINWAWVEGFRQARDEGCEEAYRLWVDDTGETDFDTFRDAWWGEADSEEAFAVEFASDTGLLADVPETVALYFDYEAYARDLFLDSFTFIDGHVFRR